jgi:hypothetical protein
MEADEERLLSLLLQGVEIVRFYSENRHAEPHFVVPADAADFLTEHRGAKKTRKGLFLDKLEASGLTRTVIGHMTSDSWDAKESHPLFSLLYWLWKIYVDEFVLQVSSGSLSPPHRTLVRAKELLGSMPCLPLEGPPALVAKHTFGHITELKELVENGERTEEAARTTVSESKNILRGYSNCFDNVRQHHSKLKDALSDFKRRTLEKIIVLDQSIEQQLEQDLRVFSWLVSLLIFVYFISYL